MTPLELNAQEQRLVDAFAGDLAAAAEQAGLDLATAKRLVTKPVVADAIRNRELAEAGKKRAVATRLERQQFWTKLMRGEAEANDLQVKASEMLARSEGDFIERRSLEGPNGGPLSCVQLQVTAVDLADRVKSLVPAAPAALMPAPAVLEEILN